MDNKYNPKIDIKFLTHISDEYDNFSSELVAKRIYSKRQNAKTFSEKIFERNAYAFSFLQSLDSLTVDSVFYLASLYDKNYIVNKSKIDNLIKAIVSFEGDFSSTATAQIFIACYTTFAKSDRKMDLSILFCNYNRIKDGIYPLIFFNSIKFEIKQLLRNGQFNAERLSLIFDKLDAKTNRYNRPHEFISLDDVLISLKNIQTELKDKYYIEKLSIYGSYSRNEASEYSDLDLFVSLSSEIVLSKYDKRALVEYLRNKLNLPVDVFLKHEIGEKKRITPDMFDSLIEVF